MRRRDSGSPANVLTVQQKWTINLEEALSNEALAEKNSAMASVVQDIGADEMMSQI